MCAGIPPPSPTVKEAREDQKVIQYIDSCIKKANESSVSRAAKIQVGRDPARPTTSTSILVPLFEGSSVKMSGRVKNYHYVSCRHSLAFQNQVKTKIHIMRVFPSICVPLKPNQVHWTLASPLYTTLWTCVCAMNYRSSEWFQWTSVLEEENWHPLWNWKGRSSRRSTLTSLLRCTEKAEHKKKTKNYIWIIIIIL